MHSQTVNSYWDTCRVCSLPHRQRRRRANVYLLSSINLGLDLYICWCANENARLWACACENIFIFVKWRRCTPIIFTILLTIARSFSSINFNRVSLVWISNEVQHIIMLRNKKRIDEKEVNFPRQSEKENWQMRRHEMVHAREKNWKAAQRVDRIVRLSTARLCVT